jgi:NAD(P)-dependent dehydrogenase (short-subunit alcohol dehydrogenase family)
VTDDGGGIAKALADRLNDVGVTAFVTERVPPGTDGAVILDGLRKVTSPYDALPVNRAAFLAARAVAPRLAADGGVFVTVQDTGGDFGLGGRQGDRAWSGGLAALARTAGCEWPRASVKAIDCEQGDRDAQQIADTIATELLTGGTLLNVGLRADGRRDTLMIKHEPDEGGRLDDRLIGSGSVIVMTGGARGVTAVAALALAHAYRPHLVLIGRTALTAEPPELCGAIDERALKHAIIAEAVRRSGRAPSPADVQAQATRVLVGREIRRTLAALAGLGCRARYVAVDVRDAGALGLALDQVRADWGPITGLVHGAGVLADGLIADKSDEAFDRVFDTKVDGLRALLSATADDPVRFVALFGSVVAQFGNAGQCDYAMANEVMFQVAAAETARVPGRRVIAIGWGPWEVGMVTPSLATYFRDRGVRLISTDQGGPAFVRALDSAWPKGRLLITAGDDGRPSDANGQRCAELEVSLVSHPQLADHRIRGVAVVPMAMALDWLVAAARDRVPGHRPVGLRALRVVRKISLEHDELRALTIVATAQDGTPVLGICREDGAFFYRALLEDAADGDLADWRSPPRHGSPVHDPYQNPTLFHGPMFRALRSVESVSEEGATGVVAGVRAANWPGRYPHTDPLAVDAAIQLAVLWAERVLGAASLPMGADRIRVHRAGSLPDDTRCLVFARSTETDQVSCDVGLLGADGRPWVELLGLTLVRRPS